MNGGAQGTQKGEREFNVPRTREQQKADTFIDDFEDALKEVVQNIDDGKLTKIDEQVGQAGDRPDAVKKIVDAVAGTNSNIEDTLFKNIKGLKRTSLTPGQKKQLQNIYTKHKPKLDSTVQSLEKIVPNTKGEKDRNFDVLKDNIKQIHEKFNEMIAAKR